MKSVVKTFSASFRYTMVWLTGQDAQLVGSNSPIVIDEAGLALRLAAPGVTDDLRNVLIGSAADLLSFFLAGDTTLRAFGAEGVLNTDDNLHLEHSAPLSIGVPTQKARNVAALTAYRESILPYLAAAGTGEERLLQKQQWRERDRLLRLVDLVHTRMFSGGMPADELRPIVGGWRGPPPALAVGKFEAPGVGATAVVQDVKLKIE